MITIRFLGTLLVVFAVTTVSQALADNWGHWRGVDGNGVAANATPPTSFSATQNVKWKVAVPGEGAGSPVIWDDQVFVVTAIPQGNASRSAHQFVLLCYDRQSGEEVWRRVATVARPHQDTHSTNGFASASPCTDGKHVYASFGSRGVYCYTMSGDLVWKRDDFPPMTTRNAFGEGSSPTLVDHLLILPWDHEGQSFLYAINKTTGENVWNVPRDEPTNWATPLIVEHAGKKQIIMNGQTKARAYDLETGAELWSCGGQTQRPVASPVQMDDLVFVGSGFRGAFLGAFQLDGEGDIEGTSQVAWTIERDTPDIASLLLSEGRLYFHKQKSGQLSCVDARTGKPYYTARRIRNLDNIYASPVAAGGHIYLSDRDGTVVVIKDSEDLQIVATNSMGETIDATPAPVDHQLFIRGAKHLFCIE